MAFLGIAIAARHESLITPQSDAAAGWCVAGATHPGRVRRANEDAFAWEAEAGAFVVCDGMGGAAGGAIASHLAAETAVAALLDPDMRAGPVGDAPANPPALIERAVRRANMAVYARARAEQRLEGMGTTLVALFLGACAGHRATGAPAQAWVAHVGDSRCYRLRGGALQPLTRDHSWVEEQVRLGRMSPSQARRSPMGNIITRAVGTRPEVEPEITEVAVQGGDLFLLATDGLTRELTEAEMQGILTESPEPETACARLIAAANRRGGRDNITCLLTRVH